MDLSTRLSYLFGTEEYVDMRRQLVLLREKLKNHPHPERQTIMICSGSLGEGVAYPTSDDDIMAYSTNTRAVTALREAIQVGDLLMVPSEFCPGYCLLLDVKGSYPGHLISIMNGMPVLSSSLWRRRFLMNGQTIHGPCQSRTIGYQDYDLARCIPCYKWPDVANEWILRNRFHTWPSYEMIENIVYNQCHVVPVGYPDSPYCQHEWRISFSVAERTLMHSFNHVQFLVYNLLRLTLKRIIGKLAPDVLCSYFMKTTLFYTSENTSIEFWRVDCLEKCFKTCLSVLYDYVYHMYCPNYFIPEYNMIRRKVNQSNRHQMLEIIRYVHRIGIVGVLCLSRESYCLNHRLSTRRIERKLDREFMFSVHLATVLVAMDDLLDTSCRDDNERYLDLLYKLSRLFGGTSVVTDNGLTNYMITRGLIIICQNMFHHLCSSVEGNKRDYGRNKRLQNLQRQGYDVDVTTGKLAMATYMYMIGKKEVALTILKQLLSEYPPYVMDVSSNAIKKTTYTDVMCGRAYRIDYKVKRSYAPPYLVYDQCFNAFPYPLRIWISIMRCHYFDPLLYTYFLQCLLYVQQRNQRLLRKCTRCLVNHINETKAIDDIADVSMYVGIIKYLQDDNQSACRWLGSVYITKDSLPPPFNERNALSALSYMSCLINKHFRDKRGIDNVE